MLIEPPDAGCRIFAAEMLQARVDALAAERAGVRAAEDIEFVHRMRVASRRLRTALGLFAGCFPAKRVTAWQADIRRITRALGAARDTDVQIACVDDFAKRQDDPRAKSGIARLLLRLRQRRAAAQRRVERALDRLEADRTLDSMAQTLRRIRVEARLQPPGEDSPALAALIARAITDHVAELLSYEPFVMHPERVEELHALRITAKRLRYTLEVFAPRFPDELKVPIKTARALQDQLGDIHDCDVWLETLPRFLEEERARAVAYSGAARGIARLAHGIHLLEDDRRTLRTTRYRAFTAAWSEALPVWEGLLGLAGGMSTGQDSNE